MVINGLKYLFTGQTKSTTMADMIIWGIMGNKASWEATKKLPLKKACFVWPTHSGMVSKFIDIFGNESYDPTSLIIIQIIPKHETDFLLNKIISYHHAN